MKALLQRVSQASVSVAGETVGTIGPGMLVLLGLDRGDNRAMAERMVDRLLGWRMFADGQGRMNSNIADSEGGILLVSQFTLSAETRRGLRPSFSSALPPDEAEPLYHYLLDYLQSRYAPVASGRFGADMQVSLVNDGPVTFLLEM